MKIVEGLKKVKMNRKRIDQLHLKVHELFAHMETDEKPHGYDNPKATLEGWVQTIHDLQKDNATILAAVQRTNLETEVTVEVVEGKPVTKTIHDWLYRRREGVDFDYRTFYNMRTNLKPITERNDAGDLKVINVVYNFPVEKRDELLATYSEEKVKIDSALEIANATTDLVGV